MDIKLTYNQRQFVFEQLNKVFHGLKLFDNKRITEIYGAFTQTILREALHTYCFHYPLKPEVIELNKGKDSEDKDIIKTAYKFKVVITMPVFGEKITVEQEIEKEILEKK